VDAIGITEVFTSIHKVWYEAEVSLP